MKLIRILCTFAMFVMPVVAVGQSSPASAQATPPDLDDPPPAQAPQAQPPPPAVTVPNPRLMTQKKLMRFGGAEGMEFGPEFGRGLGAWWKNSEVVSKLQLNDDQVKKISQTFLDHRLKLIDLRADLEKQELRLQPLLDADQPDEGKVSAQIDLITAARGKLEKENALMMLAIRRDLSVDQWKKLQALQEERRPRTFRIRTGAPVPPGAEGGAVIMKGPDAPE